MKVKLTLEIDYDVSAFADESDAMARVRDLLHGSIDRMVDNGGLSGDTSIEVHTWKVHTELTEG